jgi:hypothetical protein
MMLCLSLPLSAGAVDDIQAVSALWDDFLSALRRGDYRSGHEMFSPESRAALPFLEFAREYGPLSAAREAVLAKPESRSARVEGDWAEIVSLARDPASGGRRRVVVAAVRNQGVWSLVAGRNEGRERLEAAARAVLGLAASRRGQPGAAKWLEDLAAAGRPVFQHYRFQTNGRDFRAIPQASGLRAFYLDAWGEARPGAGSAPVPAPLPDVPGKGIVSPPPFPLPPEAGAPAAPPPAGRLPAGNGGLPELSEPPPSPEPGDLPEPPNGGGLAGPEWFSLPDAIN